MRDDSDYTKEELSTEITITLKLSHILRVHNAIRRRVKDAERDLKRAPEQERERVIDRIEKYKQLLDVLDEAIDGFDGVI